MPSGSNSGYVLYMSSVKDRVIADLRSGRNSGEKLTSGEVSAEISKRWYNLSQGTKDIWNNKN
jgi:hypothetical protein